MPIPSSITDLSQTAASNYPSGSDSPSTLDDTQRAHASFIALLRDGKGQTNSVSLASATTTDIGGQNSQFVEVTGTTTITSFGSTYNGPRYVRFTGALTLTHNATTLNIYGGASVTTSANYMVIAVPNVALNGWNVWPVAGTSGSYAASGANNDITSLGALTTVPTVVATYASQLKGISASVAANAMTVSASALSLDFRSTTLGSGTVTTVSGTPSNLVIPASATLGTVNAVQSDIYVLALNNAGTIELAVVNVSGGVDLSETGLISTTAISGLATSATVIYSTTARTNVAYRVIGLIRSTQATAGTWATAPSLIQGAGGNALDSLGSLGYGQTWQDVTGSRAKSTNYYNTTGKPIFLSVVGVNSSSNMSCTVNGVSVSGVTSLSGSTTANWFGVIPPGASYNIQYSGTVGPWSELR